MRFFSARGSILLGAVLACGCALFAKKPPTPAAEITGEQLAQIPHPAGERYFIVFFGSQDTLHLPSHTHTSATLIRVPASEVGQCGSVVPGHVDPALKVDTISWLPVSGVIDSKSRCVEPGRNYRLNESLRFLIADKQSVAVWGPYEVWHGFAQRFLIQKEFLDSGAIGYQCIDSKGESAKFGNGCDCVHAITDMDPKIPRYGYPLIYYGKAGTAHTVRRFMRSPIWIHPHETHDWLLPRLGMDAYTLEHRRHIGISKEHDPNSTAGLGDTGLLPQPSAPDPNPPTGVPEKKPAEPMKER